MHLTRRALWDIDAIDQHSVERWGQKVADQYIDDLSAAVQRLQDMPDLLQERPEISLRLRFYRAREHVSLCDVIDGQLYILAVTHGRMDLPERVAELEPQLVHEAQLLHDRILGE